MARRVFPELCMRARRAGAQRLTFTAELDEALVDPNNGVGTDRAWSCEAWGCKTTGAVQTHTSAKCFGRSGEEALRLVVDALENNR